MRDRRGRAGTWITIFIVLLQLLALYLAIRFVIGIVKGSYT